MSVHTSETLLRDDATPIVKGVLYRMPATWVQEHDGEEPPLMPINHDVGTMHAGVSDATSVSASDDAGLYLYRYDDCSWLLHQGRVIGTEYSGAEWLRSWLGLENPMRVSEMLSYPGCALVLNRYSYVIVRPLIDVDIRFLVYASKAPVSGILDMLRVRPALESSVARVLRAKIPAALAGIDALGRVGRTAFQPAPEGVVGAVG